MCFLYGGMETSMGFWLSTVLVEGRAVASTTAGVFTAVFYASTMIGRMLFGILANRLRDIVMIRFGVGIAVVGLAIIFRQSSIVGAALVGLGFAPIFPCLINDTGNRFNPKILTKLIGFEIAAYGVGASVLSPLKGPLLAFVSLEALFPTLFIMTILLLAINELLERYEKQNSGL